MLSNRYDVIAFASKLLLTMQRWLNC